MSNKKIVRAWKDAEYRNTLSDAERAALPPNPAGSIELSDTDLGLIAGGVVLTKYCTKVCTAFGSCDCSTAWPKGKPC
jgi:mersacidin/lichenicidin family type 2 lantibiotic